jgi:hypothetical protein
MLIFPEIVSTFRRFGSLVRLPDKRVGGDLGEPIQDESFSHFLFWSLGTPPPTGDGDAAGFDGIDAID